MALTMTERRGNLMMPLPANLMELWPGCAHQDCLPACWHDFENGHCARLAEWLRTHGEQTEQK